MKRPGRNAVLRGIAFCCAALLLTAASKEHDTAPAQLEFGVEMAKRGLWSEALFRFKQAESLAPGDPSILNNMAVAFEALGRFDKALEYYQRAIKADRANRDLKRNYSRFIEFYRAFRPDESKSTDEPTDQIADDGGTSP